MGFSTADQFNQTPMIKGGPAAYSEDLQDTGTDPNQPMIKGGPAAYSEDLQVPGSDTMGMGGKAGLGLTPQAVSNQMMATNPQTNVQQVPAMNPPQTGLPGLPVPVAQMTPLGPGLGNPGGQGVQPQQISRPAPMPPAQSFNPNRPMIKGGPVRPNLAPDRLIGNRAMNQVPRVGNFSRQSSIRGAGRGGLLR
jgi:hypothetical protein